MCEADGQQKNAVAVTVSVVQGQLKGSPNCCAVIIRVDDRLQVRGLQPQRLVKGHTVENFDSVIWHAIVQRQISSYSQLRFPTSLNVSATVCGSVTVMASCASCAFLAFVLYAIALPGRASGNES